jgi:hypothetical protein
LVALSTQIRRLMHTTMALPSIFEPLLEMVDQVGRDQAKPLLRAYDGSQLRPL